MLFVSVMSVTGPGN